MVSAALMYVTQPTATTFSFSSVFILQYVQDQDYPVCVRLSSLVEVYTAIPEAD